MKSKFIKSLFLLSISSNLLVTTPLISLANDNKTTINNREFSIASIDQNSFLLKENGKVSYMYIFENNTSKTLTLIDSNGQKCHFIYNKTENTIYSSITNTLTTLEDDLTNPALLSKTKVYNKTNKISFKTLRAHLGASSTALQLAGIIVLLTVPEAANAAAILEAIAIGAGYYANNLPDDPNHGIAVNIEVTQHYRRRIGGHSIPWGKTYKLISIYKY